MIVIFIYFTNVFLNYKKIDVYYNNFFYLNCMMNFVHFLNVTFRKMFIENICIVSYIGLLHNRKYLVLLVQITVVKTSENELP